MTSLRLRLFAVLLAATGVIWLSAVGWIDVSSRRQLERMLDNRLQEAARTVSALLGSASVAVASADPGTAFAPASYEHQISCQIWSVSGRLVAKSSNAPDGRLTDVRDGFSDRVVDGIRWRVFAVENPMTGTRVLVGDRLGLREDLIRDLVRSLLTPALLIAPLLAALIWFALDRGLRPLRRVADELARRDASDMAPIPIARLPNEVAPLLAALNDLFGKVEAARRHERDVTAFAAHELRTPLAGLRTQAQVALGTADPTVRDRALRQILAAVDRTTRLIRQLLIISRLDAAVATTGRTRVDLGAVVSEVAAVSGSDAAVVIGPDLYGTWAWADRDALTLALRNLHENALNYLPPGGRVTWGVDRAGDRVSLYIQDEGPGIPTEELGQVRGRFFRGRHRSPIGSGLGLAIVEVAVARCGGSLDLANRDDRSGLRATVVLDQADAPHAPDGVPEGGTRSTRE